MDYQSLQDTVAQFTRMGNASNGISGPEDGSHIFEVYFVHGSIFQSYFRCFYLRLYSVFFSGNWLADRNGRCAP